MPPKKKTKKDTKKEEENKEEEVTKEEAEKEDDDKKEASTEEAKKDEDGDAKMEDKKEEAKKEDEEDDEETDEESEEEAESTDDEDRGRGKRKRKSSLNSSFQPEDFTEREMVPASARIIKGRGDKLGDIPAVKASIESSKTNSQMLLSAHKFLFSMRGMPAKKDLKKNLLDFSGYLKELPKNYDEKHQEKEDEDLETIYSKKAYKMTTAQLKSMIDFFVIDRFTESPGGSADKETLVDYLLDFLGAPDPDLIVKPGEKPGKKTSPKKKKKSPAKKKKRAPPKKPEDPFVLVREHKKGDKPSEEALRQWVRAYVVCFDMDKATTKHAITTATERFGIDMAKRKSTIKHLLTEEM